MKGPPALARQDGSHSARPLGWADLGVATALAAAVAAIYGQVVRHRFVYLDDDIYIFSNPHVTRGLSWDGLIWAFTQFHAANWHPLTWLSHMLDCQLFGATQQAAGAHHLVSVGLHGANAILLFLSVRLMTGDRWPSAFVSGLFAMHPLRVESVAWACERKDVLSGFFFMLTLLAYARYAKHPRPGAYLLVLASAMLGLLSKPMLVTLPFVLLLLDFWPLRRLLLEKVPLLAAAAGVSALTLHAQETGGAMSSIEVITPPWRLVTAALAYATYLWKTLWPTGLVVLYVHPATLRSPDIRPFIVPSAAAALFLAVVTAVAVRYRRRRPYLLIGWLWYLGMLVPVIGLVHVGTQLWADRYAYLPLVGAYLAFAWGVRDLVAGHPLARAGAGVVACAALAACAVAARVQVAVWRDSRKLFEHALKVTRDNWVVENNLGGYLSMTEPKSPDARRHLEEALRIRPDYPAAHGNLADVLFSQGFKAEARRHWEAALRIRPDMASAHVGLGKLLTVEGNLGEARRHFEEVLRLDPKHVDAHAHLGILLAGSGNFDEARAHLEEAFRLDPNSVLAEHAFARWLATAPNPRERDPRRAVELARRAAQQSKFRQPEVLVSLAAAYAAAGEFRQAAAWERRALELAPEGDRASYRARLRLYQAGRGLPSGDDP